MVALKNGRASFEIEAFSYKETLKDGLKPLSNCDNG
jgi:hypothetical protein